MATFASRSSTPIPEEYQLIDRYWRASNYLAVGQSPLTLSDVKSRLLGHFGTTPGQNFIYCHLNKLINDTGRSVIYISGPGHGGPAIVAQVYLEGTYTEYYPDITEDAVGMGKLFKQFSFPGGIPSHVAPETPGSMHEGGELGYSLSHAYGAVLDKPDLLVACVVGDGEAETGPLATSWHANKFLNPKTDGAVLPILHLNGYKIANPTVLDRIPRSELTALFVGYGYDPIIVEGDDPAKMHPLFADALQMCNDKITSIQATARSSSAPITRPAWPMIILRTPKGWTGPKELNGKLIEGTWRSHQVPMSSPAQNPSHFSHLEAWLRSYDPDSLFDEDGALMPELKSLVPPYELRMGNNPFTNPRVKRLRLPPFADYGIDIPHRGAVKASDTTIVGKFLRDVIRKNESARNFRVFGPDETASNRLHALFEATDKQFLGEIIPSDENMSNDGRVMEMLSEHQCEGWLEGYLLTGGHGLLNSYEAFIHIIDSMFNQHAKWLKMCKDIEWRNNLASLNILLASHVWRQDHNGFTHQDPGFLDHVINKKPEIIRIYLPPDANCLLSVMDHCLSSCHKVNVIVAGKHPSPQWLPIDEATSHCTKGVSVWEWASNDRGVMPHVIVCAAGDVPTLEALAATSILRKKLPKLKVRFINVVNLMKLALPAQHPNGLCNQDFDSMFTVDTPIVFAFHGYPHLVERLLYRRKNHNLTVKGYVEEGTISTPFDMTVMNKLDRFHLVIDVCDVLERDAGKKVDAESLWTAAYVKQEMQQLLVKHKSYIREHGSDMPEVIDWVWNNGKPAV
eukprot:CAMPEP_0116012102 /NCGR_PEP_ID=MMETSP0321-20121206/4938_1 /TAXON_ID=163516 /ORGANISM="Leptocylindrus danicus var. danicus, Strain B650" /LENGTH=794 /DNA_ID=CAMNT_0003481411 /DNA_START=45 /DNA_END=2429 /DNA_ORIENTATION=+